MSDGPIHIVIGPRIVSLLSATGMASPAPGTASVLVETTKGAATGFSSVSVERSMEQACSTFALEVPVTDPARLVALNLAPGKAIVVRALSEGEEILLLAGYIDRVSASYSARDRKVSISGRSRTQEIVDSSVYGVDTTFRGQTAFGIIKALCGYYDVEVWPDLTAEQVGPPIDLFRAEQTETVYEACERVCRMRGLLLTDDERGRLILTRYVNQRAARDLVSPRDILTADLTYDASQLYTAYRVIGQRAGSATEDGHTIEALEADAWIFDRTRVLTIQAETAVDPLRATVRATWEAVARQGKATALSVTVRKWREVPGGRLWAPNRTLHVQDDLLGVDADMVITGVRFRLDNEGERTELELAPPGAYEPTPPEEQRAKDKTGKGIQKGHSFWVVGDS